MKILVIDDDDSVRESLAEILETSGYDVVMASDGERGIAVFRDTRPDLGYYRYAHAGAGGNSNDQADPQ